VCLLTIINCVIWDLVGYGMSKDVYSGTYTAISIEQTKIQREIEWENENSTIWADLQL
jgi:hypothetical protein